jgi:hypothetical protein
MTIGAVVGFLVWFTADFMLYGISNVMNIASALIDPLLEAVPSALAGGAVAAALRRIPGGGGDRPVYRMESTFTDVLLIGIVPEGLRVDVHYRGDVAAVIMCRFARRGTDR